jgi:hypothetical protein
MARVAVIGEPLRIHRYGPTGATLCPAADAAEAVLAWRDMPDDVEVAVLTPNAARWLASEIARRPGVLPVLLPDGAAGRQLSWPGLLREFCAGSEPGPPLRPSMPSEPGVTLERGLSADQVMPPDPWLAPGQGEPG